MLDIKTFKSALEQLEEEKKIPKEKILDAIEQAMAAAYKKDYGKKGQIIRAKFDLETGKTDFFQIKIVVDDTIAKIEEDNKEEPARPHDSSGAGGDVESVHLASWPKKQSRIFSFGKSKIIPDMEEARKVVSLGLEARQKAGIKVRQPLALSNTFGYQLKTSVIDLVKDELNVKKIQIGEGELDVKITPELKKEGDYRELVRAIQDMRKKIGLTPSDMVSLMVETSDEGRKLIQKFEAELLKTILASKIEFKRNEGDEIKIDELVFKVKIDKI